MAWKPREMEFDSQQEAETPVEHCGLPSLILSGYWKHFLGGKAIKM
jgi:hypothetical protein